MTRSAPAAVMRLATSLAVIGRAALGFAVLPRVAKIRNHRRNAIGRRPLQAVDPDQQFHQIFIHWRGGGLHDVAIAAADVFVEFDDQFAVGEGFGAGLAEGDAPIFPPAVPTFWQTASARAGGAGRDRRRFCPVRRIRPT